MAQPNEDALTASTAKEARRTSSQQSSEDTRGLNASLHSSARGGEVPSPRTLPARKRAKQTDGKGNVRLVGMLGFAMVAVGVLWYLRPTRDVKKVVVKTDITTSTASKGTTEKTTTTSTVPPARFYMQDRSEGRLVLVAPSAAEENLHQWGTLKEPCPANKEGKCQVSLFDGREVARQPGKVSVAQVSPSWWKEERRTIRKGIKACRTSKDLANTSSDKSKKSSKLKKDAAAAAKSCKKRKKRCDELLRRDVTGSVLDKLQHEQSKVAYWHLLKMHGVEECMGTNNFMQLVVASYEGEKLEPDASRFPHDFWLTQEDTLAAVATRIASKIEKAWEGRPDAEMDAWHLKISIGKPVKAKEVRKGGKKAKRTEEAEVEDGRRLKDDTAQDKGVGKTTSKPPADQAPSGDKTDAASPTDEDTGVGKNGEDQVGKDQKTKANNVEKAAKKVKGKAKKAKKEKKKKRKGIGKKVKAKRVKKRAGKQDAASNLPADKALDPSEPQEVEWILIWGEGSEAGETWKEALARVNMDPALFFVSRVKVEYTLSATQQAQKQLVNLWKKGNEMKNAWWPTISETASLFDINAQQEVLNQVTGLLGMAKGGGAQDAATASAAAPLVPFAVLVIVAFSGSLVLRHWKGYRSAARAEAPCLELAQDMRYVEL